MDKVKITWTVTRKIGLQDVTLTLESEAPFGTSLIEIDLLQGKCEEAIKHYINQYVPKMAVAPKPGVGQVGETETLPADRLEVRVEKGVRLFRVMGGKYGKHGVPFYDEHIKMGGVEPKDIPDVGWNLKDKYTFTVELEGGKPKRVLSINKVGAK
jgi:hypothetical protein